MHRLLAVLGIIVTHMGFAVSDTSAVTALVLYFVGGSIVGMASSDYGRK